jgi:hypothetical protein
MGLIVRRVGHGQSPCGSGFGQPRSLDHERDRLPALPDGLGF